MAMGSTARKRLSRATAPRSAGPSGAIKQGVAISSPFSANLASATGHYVSLSAKDYDSLRTRRLQLKPFRQRSGHHPKSSAGINKEVNVFDMSRAARQIPLYMKKSHLKTCCILTQPPANTTSVITVKEECRCGNLKPMLSLSVPLRIKSVEGSKACANRRIEKLKSLVFVAIGVVTPAMFGPVAEARESVKIPRIGLLTSGGGAVPKPFQQRLEELGYVQGKTI